MSIRPIRIAALAMIVLSAMVVASCSKGIDGKYVSTAGIMTIEFKSGKATVTIAGESKTLDYTVDGDKITIQGPDKTDKPLVLTRMADGTLEGAMMTFKKAAS